MNLKKPNLAPTTAEVADRGGSNTNARREAPWQKEYPHERAGGAGCVA